MNYWELKAADQENDQQRQNGNTSIAETIETLTPKPGKTLANLPARVRNKLRYWLNLASFWIKRKIAFPQKLDYPRHDLYMQVSTLPEYHRLRPYLKEPWTVEWIETSIQPGDVFYDIGANIGGYSLIAAQASAGQANVFAFEPGYATFHTLCDNIVLNHCEKNITPFPIALSNQTELTHFNYSSLESGAALHNLGKTEELASEGDAPLYQQVVVSYSLDDFIAQFSLPVPNHIKLDVDGTELAVLHGAKQTLANPRVRSLMVELNEDEDRSDEEIVRLLELHGFCLTRREVRYDDTGKRLPWSFCIFRRD